MQIQYPFQGRSAGPFALLAVLLLTLLTACSDEPVQPTAQELAAAARAREECVLESEDFDALHADSAFFFEADQSWHVRKKRPVPPQAVASARGTSKGRTRPAPPKALTGPVSLPVAHARFKSFAGKWLGKISRNLRYTPSNMQVKPHADGYEASFSMVDHESLTLEVKPSTSKTCAFVGVMKYLEKQYTCRAGTEEAARKGPFSIKPYRTIEIFRFSKGRWVN